MAIRGLNSKQRRQRIDSPDLLYSMISSFLMGRSLEEYRIGHIIMSSHQVQVLPTILLCFPFKIAAANSLI